MQTAQAKEMEALQAMDTFLDDHAAQLADVINSGARQGLRDAITRVSVAVAEQTEHHLAEQGSTQRQRDLREALLRDYVTPIVTIAKADLRSTPDVKAFRMPAAKPGTAKLAGMARGIAQAAAPFAATFVAAGLPQDFVARTNAAADALTESVRERAQSRALRTRATKNVGLQLSSARKAARVLDALMKSVLKDDAGLLRAWKSVKRDKESTSPGVPLPAPIPAPAKPPVAA